MTPAPPTPVLLPFLDRDPQITAITGHADSVLRDAAHFKVLEILGFGGMGKTRLLEELRLRLSEQRGPVHLVWVSLEAEASMGSIGPLLAMRDQVDAECLLFDTALVTYWNTMGQPLQLGRSGRLADSLPVKALELGVGAAGYPLPIGFGLTVFEALKRLAVKRRLYTKGEFEEIELLRRRPEDLLQRLPYYLGIDLRRSMQVDDESFLAFYDAYDRQKLSTREAKAPWLQQLIATLGQGVHVVAARDALHWDESDWHGVLEPVEVGPLPEAFARTMLSSRLGQLGPAVEDRLLSAARQIPFLLETVITAYGQLAQRRKPVSLEGLPSSPDSALAYLLGHLPDTQRELAIALSTFQVFDEPSFQSIVRALNIQISFQAFDSFVAWYFVEVVSTGLYKTHDLMSGFVRESTSHERARIASLEAVTAHLRARCMTEDAANPDNVLPILRAAIAGWYSTREMGTGPIEKLVDIGFLLYDAGYWNELATLGSERSGTDDHPADVLLEFFLALTARRVFGVEVGVERFAALLPRAPGLGRHKRAVELEAAYVSGLAGDYGHARKEFRRLVDTTEPFDPTDRTHVHARMYHGGMLLMDGAFRSSSRLLLETYEKVEATATHHWAELVRYRGHAHRFSFDLDQAEALYLRAMAAAAATGPALLGRLHTNLAETYCWSDPPRAMEEADAGVEIHAALGNGIELAKCDTARGMALAKLGHFDEARAVTSRALDRADEIGYEAGFAFALQARAVVECLAGDRDAAVLAADQLGATVERIDTYRHLQAVPFLLLGEYGALACLEAAIEWLGAEPFERRMASFQGPC